MIDPIASTARGLIVGMGVGLLIVGPLYRVWWAYALAFIAWAFVWLTRNK